MSPQRSCGDTWQIGILYSADNQCFDHSEKLRKHRNGGWWLTLQWSHNECDGVSNHCHLDCLLGRLFRRRSKKTSKLLVTGLCEGNALVTGGFPSLWASNAENVSIWLSHHGNPHPKSFITQLPQRYWLQGMTVVTKAWWFYYLRPV